jgi:glycosyltransferase involved in cell wall biosynthesis
LEISQSADVLFSICDPVVPNYRHASANKLFEAMMLAKPIIVARDTNMDQMVEEYHCGLVVPYGDNLALQESLEFLANNIDDRLSLGRNGRQVYEEFYSWDKMEKRLLGLYAELV